LYQKQFEGQNDLEARVRVGLSRIQGGVIMSDHMKIAGLAAMPGPDCLAAFREAAKDLLESRIGTARDRVGQAETVRTRD
jgi:hypothetical protein